MICPKRLGESCIENLREEIGFRTARGVNLDVSLFVQANLEPETGPLVDFCPEIEATWSSMLMGCCYGT